LADWQPGQTITAAVGLVTTCIPTAYWLDPNSGKLKWCFQFTRTTLTIGTRTKRQSHQCDFRGKPRKLLIQANRNGFYYVLDRLTGEFLLGKASRIRTGQKGWMQGRPILKPHGSDPEGTYVCPMCRQHELASPSYDSRTGLFYVAVKELARFTSTRSSHQSR
jgi:alcohol dehydrogenase (cytochrome c)